MIVKVVLERSVTADTEMETRIGMLTERKMLQSCSCN